MTSFEEKQDRFDRHAPDVSDKATLRELEDTANAIDDVRAACVPKQKPRADGTYEFEDCEDCGNEIGEQRLRVAIHNHLCVHCASARERRSTK